MKNYIRTMLMAAVALLMLCGLSLADTPGKHPAYLHALTDLRHARAILFHGESGRRADANEQAAVDEIDAAIHELTEASIDDAKPMTERFPVDSTWTRGDRLQRVLELLQQAQNNVDQPESNGYSRKLAGNALHHIKDARKAVKKAEKHKVYE